MNLRGRVAQKVGQIALVWLTIIDVVKRWIFDGKALLMAQPTGKGSYVRLIID